MIETKITLHFSHLYKWKLSDFSYPDNYHFKLNWCVILFSWMHVLSIHHVACFVQYKLFTDVGIDYERFGEKALLENKEQRDLRSRLQNIEDELQALHTSHELEVTNCSLLGGGTKSVKCKWSVVFIMFGTENGCTLNTDWQNSMFKYLGKVSW